VVGYLEDYQKEFNINPVFKHGSKINKKGKFALDNRNSQLHIQIQICDNRYRAVW
jgi:hypothetical protein